MIFFKKTLAVVFFLATYCFNYGYGQIKYSIKKQTDFSDVKKIWFTPSGKKFVLVCGSGVEVRDTKTENCIKTIYKNPDYLQLYYPIAIDTKEQLIAFAVKCEWKNVTIKIFDFETGKLKKEFSWAHEIDITHIEFDASGKKVMTVDMLGTIKIWDIENNGNNPIDVYSGKNECAKIMEFSKTEGKRGFWMTTTGELFSWDENLNNLKKYFKINSLFMYDCSLAYEPSTQRIAAHEDGSIKIIDVMKKEIIAKFSHEYEEDYTLLLKFDPFDEKHESLVSIDKEGILKFWNISRKNPLVKEYKTGLYAHERDIAFMQQGVVSIVSIIHERDTLIYRPNAVYVQIISLK